MELEYRAKGYYKKKIILFFLLFLLLSPHPHPSALPLPSFYLFFWKPVHYVAQAGLEVESAGITGIPIMPSWIIPLTVVILWDTPPHTHPFLKKALSPEQLPHSKLLHGLSFSSPRRLLAC